jgi:EmrB/QacA subfamily drug resistance transporter
MGRTGAVLATKWWTLIAVCVATFMLLLDIAIVTVALPDIQQELHASFSDLQWVIDAYALSLATFVLTAGALADLYGRKLLFVAGLVVFTGGSLLCALATSPIFLILARGLQGVGGAVMFATSLALLSQEFHGRERGMAFGLWGATIGGAFAIGPLVGGALTTGLGWRWIFYVNLPIGIAAIVMSVLRLRESKDPQHARLDLAGLVTFCGGMFLLIFALVRGNDEGWSSGLIVACLAGAVGLLAAFLVVELIQEKPMVDLTLFAKPAFSGAQIAAFTISAGIFSLLLYLTLYLQNILGYSPLQAGLRILPISLLSFTAALISGRLSGHVPVRLLLGGGLGLAALGTLLLHGLDTSSDWTALLPGFLVMGFGIGLVNPALATTAVGVVTHERAGMASGINNTARQAGVATGVAALGAVFLHHVQTSVATAASAHGLDGAKATRLATAVSSGRAQLALSHVPASTRAALEHAGRAAFVGGLNEIFVVGAALAFVGAALSFVLVRPSDFVGSPQAATSS